VNKRVSRLAANIPFIKGNLSPLSFVDVPRQTYTEAVLGGLRADQDRSPQGRLHLGLRTVSCRYAAVRQSLGEPDPFRLRYREELRKLIADLVRARVSRKDAAARIAAWSQKEIDPDGRRRFAELAETELIGLHEGNFALIESVRQIRCLAASVGAK